MSNNQEAILDKYVNMGFPMELVLAVLEQTKGKDDDNFLNLLIAMNDDAAKVGATTSIPQNPSVNANEDVEMNKAIEASLKDTKNMPVYEPLNPEQRIRKQGFPVGLKNVGNSKIAISLSSKACYVNSLLQTYFANNEFARAVLEYDPDVSLPEEQKQAPQAPSEKDVKRIRIEASIKMMKQLQKLYAFMIKSNKKYIDPTEVLRTVVDDLGQPIPIGDQRDVSEYHLIFLSRVEEALFYQGKYKKSKELQDPSIMQIEDIPEGFLEISTKKSDERQASLVSNIFFGSFRQYLSFQQENENLTEEETGEFGPLILDIAYKELYTSLENYTETQIEGYRTPKGEITTATSKTWIKKFPECIFFQLQRVDFDKETGNPVKKNDSFTFEKEIYLDRFLLENKEEATKINSEITSLRARLSLKVESLEKISNYMNSQLDIIRVLGLGSDFLKNQIEVGALNGSAVVDPTILGDLGDKTRISAALNVLEEYKNKLEKTTQELKDEIIEIKKHIHELNSKLSKNKYHLAAVLIHDGHAGSGHYYSFNRNIKNDSWKKYNDIQITEEKEELVFKESIGGYANVSAYCLVYISDAQVQRDIENAKTFEAVETMEALVEKAHYQVYLSPKLVDEVETDNCVFKEEIEEYKFSTYLKSITDAYKARLDHLEKELKVSDDKKPPRALDSFGAFLKKDSTLEKFYKWYVVDSVLKDSQHKLSLKDMKSSQLKLLENRLNSLSKPYSFNHLKLDDSEKTKFEAKLHEFQQSFAAVIHCKYLLKAAVEENWMDVSYNAKKALELDRDPKSFNTRVVKDSVKTFIFKLALYIERDAYHGKLDEVKRIISSNNKALKNITFLTGLMKGVLNSDDLVIEQIRMILADTQTRSKEVLDEEKHQLLKHEIYKSNTAGFSILELGKVVKDYIQKDVEDEIETHKADIYNWNELNEKSMSNQIIDLMNKFRESCDMVVPFRAKVTKDKIKLKFEEREKEGFVLKEDNTVLMKKVEP